jgi:hypothetical protein
VTGRFQAAPTTPPQIAAQLTRLRAAFPAFSFKICHGWHGWMFEAWRDAAAGGLYAVITSDADEMRRELEQPTSPACPDTYKRAWRLAWTRSHCGRCTSSTTRSLRP